MYFDASSAPSCQTDGAYSCRGGTFTPANSKSYHIVEPAPAFDTKFGDGSTASGPFAEDVVCISDVCISDVQFGVATEVKSTTGYAIGLMGLGYSANEATHHEYPNIPEVLRSAGVINSRLYSVYLNDEGATSGSILFGGIDTAKFTGPLQIVDILPDAVTEYIDQFITTVTALKVTVSGQTSSIFSGGSPGIDAYRPRDAALPVLLDTGSSAWTVPAQYFDAIVSAFPYVSSNGIVDCVHASSSDTMTLTFAGAVDITVPAKDFIVPAYNRTTNVGYQSASGAQQCVFMITPEQNGGTGMGFETLGDAVLRSMYVVFDLDNGQMGIAQADVNSTASPNIQIVAAGPNGIEKAVSNARQPVIPSASASASAFPIANGVNGTATYSVETMATTIGTATGTNAVPADARVSASSAAGPSLNLRGVEDGSWRIGFAVVFGMIVGGGLVVL